MFSHAGFELTDSNSFSMLCGMDKISPNAESSASKTEFSRRKRHMTKETIEKRKQQNRTAQKAFRERKERHLRDIESQLSYKQHQLHAMCGQNRYLEEKCQFLSNQYVLLEKKLEEAEGRLKRFEDVSSTQVPIQTYDHELPKLQVPVNFNAAFVSGLYS